MFLFFFFRNSRSITTEQDETANALRERIRVLEQTLSTLQASRSSQTPDSLASPESMQNEAGNVDELTENLGTLSMTGYGKSRFFGTNGGAVERLVSRHQIECGQYC